MRAMLRDRLDLPACVSTAISTPASDGMPRRMRTTHVEAREEHVPPLALAKLDVVGDKDLVRDGLDDGVPRALEAHGARLGDEPRARPVVRVRDEGEAEETVGRRERDDRLPEELVVRRDLPVFSSASVSRQGRAVGVTLTGGTRGRRRSQLNGGSEISTAHPERDRQGRTHPPPPSPSIARACRASSAASASGTGALAWSPRCAPSRPGPPWPRRP